jgi:hypothetical protein
MKKPLECVLSVYSNSEKIYNHLNFLIFTSAASGCPAGR